MPLLPIAVDINSILIKVKHVWKKIKLFNCHLRARVAEHGPGCSLQPEDGIFGAKWPFSWLSPRFNQIITLSSDSLDPVYTSPWCLKSQLVWEVIQMTVQLALALSLLICASQLDTPHCTIDKQQNLSVPTHLIGN